MPISPIEIEQRRVALSGEFGEEITLDGLTRDFKIFQRRRGHRHSTDDLLTAWYAIKHAPKPAPARLLDLGTGVGSVGLGVLYGFPDSQLTAIEVQQKSFRLLRENIWANDLGAQVRTIFGDLRESVPPEKFDLVTGSPPYFDVKSGIVSADSQRAAARFELHGNVNDYCRAAKKSLDTGGRFIFCFPSAQRARAIRACHDAELSLEFFRDVIPKKGLAPLFTLFACSELANKETTEESPYVVRDEQGATTPEHHATRALFGMG